LCAGFLRAVADVIIRDLEGIHITLESKTGRGVASRTIQAFKDVAEVKDVVEKLDGILQKFKVCGIDQLFPLVH